MYNIDMDENDVYIEDEKGRTLLIVNGNGEVAISRFPDLTEETKTMMVDLYVGATGADSQKVMDFLNYDSDENTFCS